MANVMCLNACVQGRLRVRGRRVGRRHGGAGVHDAAARRLPTGRPLRGAKLDRHRARADRVGEARCRRHRGESRDRRGSNPGPTQPSRGSTLLDVRMLRSSPVESELSRRLFEAGFASRTQHPGTGLSSPHACRCQRVCHWQSAPVVRRQSTSSSSVLTARGCGVAAGAGRRPTARRTAGVALTNHGARQTMRCPEAHRLSFSVCSEEFACVHGLVPSLGA